MGLIVEHDANNKRFILFDDGKEIGHSEYVEYEKGLDIRRTVVDVYEKGNDLKQHLIFAAADHADNNGLEIIMTCGHAKKVLLLGEE